MGRHATPACPARLRHQDSSNGISAKASSDASPTAVGAARARCWGSPTPAPHGWSGRPPSTA